MDGRDFYLGDTNVDVNVKAEPVDNCSVGI